VALALTVVGGLTAPAHATGPGLVAAWGYNASGQLGNGTNSSSNVPVQSALTGATAVAIGGYHTLALQADGTVLAWGQGTRGQLGNGTFANSSVPVQVLDPSDPSGRLTGVIAVGNGGLFHNLALKSNGTVVAWGWNENGQLGNGSYTNSSVAVQVLDPSDPSGRLTGIIAVVPGSQRHSLAVRSNGTVVAWGYNGMGALGTGGYTSSNVPRPVVDPADPTGRLTGVTSVAGGIHHSVALKSDGSVVSWGWNGYGQLGNGTFSDTTVPVPASVSGVTAVSTSGYHVVALKGDGSVVTWGHNDYGQLGNGTNAHNPAPVTAISSGVTSVSAGVFHNLALKSDGSVAAWGWNQDGQLGNGTNANSSVPVAVSGLAGVTMVTAGGQHSAALFIPAPPPDVTPPVITVPADITVEATSSSGAAVTFAVSATDSHDGPVAASASPASGSVFPLGATTVSVTAEDAAGNESTKTFVVTVVDTTAPVISGLSVNPSVLTVPNHKMVDVTVSYSVSDNTGATVTLSVTSNEPDNGLGDGDTADDIQVVDDHLVRLRAERSGKGTGRVYTITVTATDSSGNSSIQQVTVKVPKGQK
jgi:alpha-tubulin suppressor-like RCC1 family protein